MDRRWGGRARALSEKSAGLTAKKLSRSATSPSVPRSSMHRRDQGAGTAHSSRSACTSEWETPGRAGDGQKRGGARAAAARSRLLFLVSSSLSACSLPRRPPLRGGHTASYTLPPTCAYLPLWHTRTGTREAPPPPQNGRRPGRRPRMRRRRAARLWCVCLVGRERVWTTTPPWSMDTWSV